MGTVALLPPWGSACPSWLCPLSGLGFVENVWRRLFHHVLASWGGVSAALQGAVLLMGLAT